MKMAMMVAAMMMEANIMMTTMTTAMMMRNVLVLHGDRSDQVVMVRERSSRGCGSGDESQEKA